MHNSLRAGIQGSRQVTTRVCGSDGWSVMTVLLGEGVLEAGGTRSALRAGRAAHRRERGVAFRLRARVCGRSDGLFLDRPRARDRHDHLVFGPVIALGWGVGRFRGAGGGEVLIAGVCVGSGASTRRSGIDWIRQRGRIRYQVFRRESVAASVVSGTLGVECIRPGDRTRRARVKRC